MVEHTGIEPVNQMCNIRPLPDDAPLVPPHRIELRIDDYKSTVIPFNYRGTV